MARTQIDPRQQGMSPHNRLRPYDQFLGGAQSEDDRFRYDEPQAPPPQQQASQPASGGFDIGQLLSGLSGISGSQQAPSWGGLDIGGYAAGGGMQVGPDGITITNPNQQAGLVELIRRSAGNEQAAIGADASKFSDIMNFGSQIGTAGINAGAQRDVAGINAQSNEAIAMTQAQSASDVANIQAQSAAEVQRLQNAGLITQQEADQKLAETNNAAQQRIAEIQAQAAVRPAELQFEQFGMGLEAIRPFMEALLSQMSGGGSFGGSGGSAYQVDPQSLVNAAQAQNAMGAAAANRTGGGGGGAAANSAAARAIAQQESAANAQAAHQIPLQVNQQNFDNRQAAQANELQRLQTLSQFIPNLFSSIG